MEEHVPYACDLLNNLRNPDYVEAIAQTWDLEMRKELARDIRKCRDQMVEDIGKAETHTTEEVITYIDTAIEETLDIIETSYVYFEGVDPRTHEGVPTLVDLFYGDINT
jgi:hypothetical protein